MGAKLSFQSNMQFTTVRSELAVLDLVDIKIFTILLGYNSSQNYVDKRTSQTHGERFDATSPAEA